MTQIDGFVISVLIVIILFSLSQVKNMLSEISEQLTQIEYDLSSN